MIYRIRYSQEALRALPRLPGRYRQRVRRLVEELAQNPHPDGAQKLRGLSDVFRVHVNGWRLIYQVDADARVLLIIGVRKKTGPETYSDLPLE